MKNFIKSLGFALALLAQPAHAVPTLFFDGDITFTSSDPGIGLQSTTSMGSLGQLSVTAVLTATQEIDPIPELMGSSLTFSAFLTEVDTSSSSITIGLFAGGAGYDFTVIDGNSNDLLLGDFDSMEMLGRNGRDSGRVEGVMSTTDGLLADMFGAGQLIALVFNIDTFFGADMFDSSFSGNIDGRIEGEAPAVPAPGVLVLLSFGLVLMGVIRRRTC